ncbi:MAG TPA: alpha/beta fold hydrolase [Flavisolibacter sp.]
MPHLLLLHGALGSGSQLQGLEELLQDQYTIHRLDLPGHGGTALPDAFSIRNFADFVEDYCRKHQLPEVHIFGYSMGGYIALYLARHRPALVGRMITLATKFRWDPATAARETKMLQPELMQEKIPQFVADLEQRHAPNDWKKVVSATADMLHQMGTDSPLQAEDFKQINHPCLLMLGDRDKMVTIEETLDVFRLLPGSQLAVLPATPHPLEQADPELLAMICRSFLS